MAYTIVRVGNVVGERADRVAITRNPADVPMLVSAVWNGSKVNHSFWDVLPNGDLAELPMDSRNGGPELAIAAFSDKRVVSMNRSGPAGALKFAAWETGGFFSLSDDLVWTNDRDPEIVTFGAGPPMAAASPAAGAGAMELTEGPKPGPGSQRPGSTPGTPPPAGPFKPVGGIGAKIGPKAGHALVVSKTADNKLRLSLWNFDNGGQIKVLVAKHAETVSGIATAVSVAKLREFWSDDLKHVKGVEVVTAVRGGAQALRLQRWRVNLGGQGTPASFEELSAVTAPESVTLVAAVPVQSLGGMQVATAVRLLSGTLKVIGWKMETGGGMTRLDDAAGGGIDALQAAFVRGRTFVTAVRESDGRFKASYWLFPNSVADTMKHHGDAVEGKIGSQLSCVHLPGVGTHIGDTVVAAQTEGGDLQLWRYRVEE